jgi:predicted nucleic acid-binding protein
MKLVLDTSVLIDALRFKNHRQELLARLVTEGHQTTALNVAEVYAGMRAEEESDTASFLGALDCLSLTARSAKRAGLLKSEWAKKGRALALVDACIAALAIEHGYSLATDNRKDFPMPELE